MLLTNATSEKPGLHSTDLQENIPRIMQQVETDLKNRIQREEAEHGKESKPPNSLWNHSLRVALLAERIGAIEGANVDACRLAGLFHDAGKFHGGSYHDDDKPEEFWSVAAFHELTSHIELPTAVKNDVEESILQLYRGDPDPTVLTKILFDADNLDKLGPLGVANFFVKTGLRGRGVAPSALYRISVELTYARYAPQSLSTQTGRRIAQRRAPETIMFFQNLLESLREDDIFDFEVHEEHFNGMIIDIVSPTACNCGYPLFREISEIPGLKCSEIHLSFSCNHCGSIDKLRFCRPRLINCSELQ